MKDATALYWLKRDFRLADNIALTAALSKHQQVTPIFIIEPSWLAAPDTSAFHVHAVFHALQDLRERLHEKGGDIAIVEGEVVPTLQKLYDLQPFDKIYAHQEIGTDRTFQRDLAVHKWSKMNKINFSEYAQTGVFRGLKNRNKRHLEWKKFTTSQLLTIPNDLDRCTIPKAYHSLTYPKRKKLNLTDTDFHLNKTQRHHVQPVSETDAEKTLNSFLYERGIQYRGGISSPLSAFTAGSRLSVHLAWGTLTGRMVYQRTQDRMDELQAFKEAGEPDAGKWRSSLRSFMSRLHWRDHFIQRLESEPTMEFQALNPAYVNFGYDNDPDFFEAWSTGYTGFPMVDACVRCLLNTGFVNFRMRAMLTSFATHILHLDWKLIDHPMARMYTDYEPGIHLSQLQMQAGVVGINTLRIYSPTKQIIDQDPKTIFVKKWVPELRAYTPNEIINHEDTPLKNYTKPIVDRKAAGSETRKRIYAVRRTPEYRAIADQVYAKHGSRRAGPKTRKPKKTA